MKIAVLAANGRTGQEFVDLSLKKGHRVRAGVYGKHNFDPNPQLEIQKCDATDQKQVEQLINGCDAVASFIGHVKNSPAFVQTDAIENSITVCEKLGIFRLISLTGSGVRFKGDHITMIDRALNLSINILDPKRVNDGKKHVELLKNSDLDWTVLRVLKLTNGPAKNYRLSVNGPTVTFTSRSTVARASLEVIENASFINQAPIISR